MDKMFIRKDVYEELLEKGFGKKDYSKLTKKVITDKNGHRRTVFVKNGEKPAEVKQPKAQEGLTPEKKAKYEEMLEKVKAGPDENALFIGSKGMLNKMDAIAYLSAKLGTKTVSSAAQGHLESDTPQNTDITKEDEERFGKQALSGLSGKRTSGNVAQKMANAEDKAYAQSEKDAKKKYGDMSIEELKAEAKKYDGVSKYSPEAVEARKVYDILNQKLEEEKKNSKTKTESKSKKFSYDDAVNAIKAGKTVQWKSRDGSWNDVDPKTSELVMARDIGSELRIKPSQDDMKEKNDGTKFKNFNDAHAYLTKLKPSSSDLKNDFEDHRDIILKRFGRGEESFNNVIKNYEKEMKISVPHMVEQGIMTFEEGNNYMKAWEDLKKQI